MLMLVAMPLSNAVNALLGVGDRQLDNCWSTAIASAGTPTGKMITSWFWRFLVEMV
jgi:hypothetical protein